MERQYQAMQASQPGDAVKKRHDHRALIQVLLGRQPGLQGTTGHVKPRGRLALRDPWGVQLARPCKEVSALEASPALIASLIATLLFWDDRCHRSLIDRSPTL
jgi:hypothetical protein